MTLFTQLKAAEYRLDSTAPVSVFRSASGMRSLSVGLHGLRAVWRLLILIGFLMVLFGGAALVSHGRPQGVGSAELCWRYFLLHGFRISGFALHGTAILSAPAEWAVAFLMVGLAQVFLHCGYLPYMLAFRIGFWPAAFVMSGFLAFRHVFNPQEALVGVAAVVPYGLLLCLLSRLSGSLWCAVGFHAACGWGQRLFGVPESGIAPYHNLFSSAFSEFQWPTGGIVGPGPSALSPIALAIVALVISRYYRGNR